jgi:hypothetical protein
MQLFSPYPASSNTWKTVSFGAFCSGEANYSKVSFRSASFFCSPPHFFPVAPTADNILTDSLVEMHCSLAMLAHRFDAERGSQMRLAMIGASPSIDLKAGGFGNDSDAMAGLALHRCMGGASQPAKDHTATRIAMDHNLHSRPFVLPPRPIRNDSPYQATDLLRHPGHAGRMKGRAGQRPLFPASAQTLTRNDWCSTARMSKSR